MNQEQDTSGRGRAFYSGIKEIICSVKCLWKHMREIRGFTVGTFLGASGIF